MASSIFSMKGASGELYPKIYLLGQRFPIISASGKEKEFGLKSSRPEDTGSDKWKGEMQKLLLASWIRNRSKPKKGEVDGYDGGKQVKGRKRQILVDTQGWLLGVVVSEANMPERWGGMAVLLDFFSQARCLSRIWVDQGYQGEKFAQAVKQLINARVEVVQRTQKQEFQV